MLGDLTVAHATVSSTECPVKGTTGSSQPELPRLWLADKWSKRMQSLDIFLEIKKKKIESQRNPLVQLLHQEVISAFCKRRSKLMPGLLNLE